MSGSSPTVPQLKAKVCEKKLFVESSTEDAVRLVEAGVDGVQLDKVAPEQVAQLVPQLKAINPHVTLIAAGGVNLGNAAEYAATGVDGLATTCLHFAKAPRHERAHERAVGERSGLLRAARMCAPGLAYGQYGGRHLICARSSRSHCRPEEAPGALIARG